MQRRAFLRVLAAALAAGATLRSRSTPAQAAAELYDLPPFGNVSLLHITDVHAQLLPIHFREPGVNIGDGHPPHLVGESLLAHQERILGPSHRGAMASWNNLAAAYRDAGRVAEAIPLHERTLADRKRILGPGHPHTLTSRDNLAAARASRS